ncbi:Uncharacterised protein [Mycobacteroides abscessus subsp. abscessus]|nr:Uncharacterised protein [Mycobacteroides abscessus subsp. abscessus]
MDHLRVGRERRQLSGDAVVEACAESDQQVGTLQCRNGSHSAVHAGHAEVLLVRIREGTASHQRGDNGDAGQLGKLEQLGRRVGLDHTATDVEHGVLRGVDQSSCLTNLLAVRLGDRTVAGQIDLRRPREGGLRLQDVLGDVDENRSGTATLGDVERLGHDPGDVDGIAHQEVVLGDRHRDAGDVGLLERVGTDQCPADLAGDRHDGHRVHLRVGQRRDEIGRTGTRRRHHDTGAAGDLCVAGGSVTSALLVTNENVAHLLRVQEGVVDRQNSAARNTENHLDAELFE